MSTNTFFHPELEGFNVNTRVNDTATTVHAIKSKVEVLSTDVYDHTVVCLSCIIREAIKNRVTSAIYDTSASSLLSYRVTLTSPQPPEAGTKQDGCVGKKLAYNRNKPVACSSHSVARRISSDRYLLPILTPVCLHLDGTITKIVGTK